MVEPSRLISDDDEDTEGHVGDFIIDANKIEAGDGATAAPTGDVSR